MDRKRQFTQARALDRPSRRSAILLLAAGVAGVLTLWLVGSTPAQASATKAHAKAKPTKITVSAGSPSEFRFKLSKSTLSAPGVVTFAVTNKGHLPHDFKIAGKVTKLLKPGKSQTLTITFKKKGSYPYLCTVTGHAAAGMKGTFKVK